MAGKREEKSCACVSLPQHAACGGGGFRLHYCMHAAFEAARQGAAVAEFGGGGGLKPKVSWARGEAGKGREACDASYSLVEGGRDLTEDLMTTVTPGRPCP
jgi:hypothetical protein